MVLPLCRALQVASLASHIAHCSLQGCPCGRFQTNWQNWQLKLPLDPDEEGQDGASSWLSFTVLSRTTKKKSI